MNDRLGRRLVLYFGCSKAQDKGIKGTLMMCKRCDLSSFGSLGYKYLKAWDQSWRFGCQRYQCGEKL